MTEHLEKMKKIESHWNPIDPLLNNLEMQTYHHADGDLCNIFWVMNHTNESVFKTFQNVILISNCISLTAVSMYNFRFMQINCFRIYSLYILEDWK